MPPEDPDFFRAAVWDRILTFILDLFSFSAKNYRCCRRHIQPQNANDMVAIRAEEKKLRSPAERQKWFGADSARPFPAMPSQN